jgi:prophage maintenance system killer protein
MTEDKDQVVLYQAPDGAITLDVRLEGETVWLTQKQMATLFDTERSVITKHLRNVFKSCELQEKSVCAKFAHTAEDNKLYQTLFYNLDAIISVGYRVNSKRGTQFRIWATNVLREHVVRGYSVNEKRLKELNQAIRLISSVAERKALSSDEATALLSVVKDYSYALDLLDDYDHERVTTGDTTDTPAAPVSYDEVRRIIERLRAQFNAGELFGTEKDRSLQGSLANIMQTFDGKELYPSLEEKAAQLLYSLVKNHSFVDGNKRIAAALFLWFLEKNATLYAADGSKRIADNALVAMTLLIAESRPEEKDALTRVVVNLINRRNM